MNKEEAKQKRKEYQKKKRANASAEGKRITMIVLGITFLMLALMFMIFWGNN